MKEKIAFLYAGQGSQKTGMGQDFYDSYPEFKKVFDGTELSFDLKEACFVNPDNILLKTQYTQPCMVAFACGITNILTQKGIIPDFVCGLSLGEYSALYAAGVWTLEDTMRIISVRGKAMAEASEGIEASMVAITSLTEAEVAKCCDMAQNEGVVSICNINSPGQVVIGGDKKAVDCAVQYAKDLGARRCIPLSVSGPFHTSYMSQAGDKLEDSLKNISFQAPKCEVLYNYLGGPNTRGDSITDLLINQIQKTVNMKGCIEYLINNNVKKFIEIGPGAVLSGFVKKTLKSLDKDENDYTIISINEKDDIQKVVDLL